METTETQQHVVQQQQKQPSQVEKQEHQKQEEEPHANIMATAVQHIAPGAPQMPHVDPVLLGILQRKLQLKKCPTGVNQVVQRVAAKGQHPEQRHRDYMYLQRTIGNRAVTQLAQLIQRQDATGEDTSALHQVAATGISGAGSKLPHYKKIQQSFGKHNVSHVQAYTNSSAKIASQTIGAEAYTAGNKVAFNSTNPSLHTTAHEATHIIQQQIGVQLKSGVGAVGDQYERHADAVADEVVKGKSVEPLLDRYVANKETSSTSSAIALTQSPQSVTSSPVQKNMTAAVVSPMQNVTASHLQLKAAPLQEALLDAEIEEEALETEIEADTEVVEENDETDADTAAEAEGSDASGDGDGDASSESDGVGESDASGEGDSAASESGVEENINVAPQPLVVVKKIAAINISSKQNVATLGENLFAASATDLARNIGALGNNVTQSFANDRKEVAAKTPAVSASLTSAGVKKPKIVKAEKPLALSRSSLWKAPRKGKKIQGKSFAPSGAANPKLADREQRKDARKAQKSQKILNKHIANNKSENKLTGKNLQEIRVLALEPSTIKVTTGITPEMQTYLNADVPETVRNMADNEIAPKLAATLAKPKAQIKQAVVTRDTSHEKSKLDAEKNADQLAKQANADQQKEINKTRDLVAAEKEKGMQESQALVKNYNKDVENKKKEKLTAVDKKIADSDKKISARFKKADKEVKKEENKAEKKKEEAKKEKPSLFGRFVKAVGNFLAKAFSGIIAALKKVVSSIINAAKAFAKSLVEGVRLFVVGLLKSFSTLLKGFTHVLLAAFPKLRKKINAAIDGFVNKSVSAVNKISKYLKSGIDTVANTLNKAVALVSNFFETAVKGAIAFIGALASGDYAALPKIMFVSAANALGLNGEELYQRLLKVGDKLLSVVLNPGKFFSNMAAALNLGFGNFSKNMGKHVVSGLMGWLLGKIPGDITIPKDFSASGLFLVVRQVLGLTLANVRTRAVKIIGEENVARLEGAFTFLKNLFTSGPEVIWEALKDKLSNIREVIVGKIKEFVIEKVVKKSIEKLAFLFNPVGAFIQSIMGIYQTIKTFAANIKRISEVVSSVMSSFTQIANGAIGPAGKLITNALVKTLPVVFSWMGNMIGLGGIGKKIQEIIDTIRAPVNKAIDAIITKAAAIGSKLIGKAKGIKDKIVEWWKMRKSFASKDGGSHEVYFKGSAKKPVLMVASEHPMSLSEIIKKKTWGTNPLDNKTISALNKINENTNETDLEAVANVLKIQIGDGDQEVELPVGEILSQEPVTKADTPIDDTGTVVAGEKSYKVATSMKVLLTPKHPLGAAPKGNALKDLFAILPTIGKYASDSSPSGTQLYIRGHLLNHNLGGLGDENNLFN
ncbi:MAG: DUF4157 domain-containing protein, partial [Gammaproteobacteria bacterium]|nr:DUF4157 domain-containing protein [Gammaproteobacteria bacterium]